MGLKHECQSIQPVHAVERAVQILEVLAQGDAGVSEISRASGIHKATVYRLLRTLCHLGFVELRPDGKGYRLGIRILELAGRRLARINVRDVCRPYLLTLRDQTRLTVHLGILDGTDIVYIEKIESPCNLRMASFVGARNPAYSTALGKAILAAIPTEQLDGIICKIHFKKRTPNTITHPDDLRRELGRVRERGYAIDNIENEDGIRCVGAPIFDHGGKVVAGISVSGPIIWINTNNLPQLGKKVSDTAKQISRALGYTISGLAGGREGE